MATAEPTTNHDEIREWVEARGGKPARVKSTGGGEDPGILRIDFPGFSGEDTLEAIEWDEFFEWFDRNGLALLLSDEEGNRFNKLVSRATAEASSPASTKSGSKRASKKRAAVKGAKRTTAKKASGSATKSSAKKASSKKRSATKTSAKKTTSKKSASAKRSSTKKSSAKSASAKKAAPRTTTSKKASSKKTTTKKATSKKTATKSSTKKTATKKTATKKTPRRAATATKSSKKTTKKSAKKTTARKSAVSRVIGAVRSAIGSSRKGSGRGSSKQGSKATSRRGSGSSVTTTNRSEIRQWVEARGGFPAHVRRTGAKRGDLGVLRIDYPGYSGKDTLERVGWDEWFKAFDRNKLAFLYQDKKNSRFSKLVAR